MHTQNELMYKEKKVRKKKYALNAFTHLMHSPEKIKYQYEAHYAAKESSSENPRRT